MFTLLMIACTGQEIRSAIGPSGDPGAPTSYPPTFFGETAVPGSGQVSIGSWPPAESAPLAVWAGLPQSGFGRDLIVVAGAFGTTDGLVATSDDGTLLLDPRVPSGAVPGKWLGGVDTDYVRDVDVVPGDEKDALLLLTDPSRWTSPPYDRLVMWGRQGDLAVREWTNSYIADVSANGYAAVIFSGFGGEPPPTRGWFEVVDLQTDETVMRSRPLTTEQTVQGACFLDRDHVALIHSQNGQYGSVSIHPVTLNTSGPLSPFPDRIAEIHGTADHPLLGNCTTYPDIDGDGLAELLINSDWTTSLGFRSSTLVGDLQPGDADLFAGRVNLAPDWDGDGLPEFLNLMTGVVVDSSALTWSGEDVQTLAPSWESTPRIEDAMGLNDAHIIRFFQMNGRTHYAFGNSGAP